MTHRHPHRPAHPARRVPAAARGRRGELPARVGRAGTARAPLVHRLRLAARHVRGGGRARTSPSSATSPTTTSRSSSRRCRCPRTAPTCRRAASSSPRRSSASTTAAARPRCWRATRTRSRARLESDFVLQEHNPPSSDATMRRSPDQATYEEGVRADPGVHPRRRRVPDRALAARRAADLRLGARSSTARCAASTRRRTSSCSSSASSRSSARRRRRSSSARAAARA